MEIFGQDAPKAGKKESLKCTLVLTEGLSAKSIAVRGYSARKDSQYFGCPCSKGKGNQRSEAQ